MADQGFIAAVRLSDRKESEQPDPLVLSGEEVTGMTWRHFETLLQSMYTQTPESIQVKYLDDENDWVEMSSDAELAEALKYTKDSGEILQLLVKASFLSCENLVSIEDTHTKEECQTPCSNFEETSMKVPIYIPTTDPGGDVLQPLVYPYPDFDYCNNREQEVAASTLHSPMIQPTATISKANHEQTGFDELCHEQAGFDGTDFQAHRLVYPHPDSPKSVEPSGAWNQASSMDTKEKVQFLKNIAQQSQAKSFDIQDPFEMVPDFSSKSVPTEKRSSCILTPIPANPFHSKERSKGLDESCFETAAEAQAPPPSTKPKVSYRSAVVPKAKVLKKRLEPGASVPIPQNVMMMQGAQSGANAVAIEMPFEPDCSDNNILKREQEIAASGSTPGQDVCEGVCEALVRSGAQASSIGKEVVASVQEMETGNAPALDAVKGEGKKHLKKKQPVEQREEEKACRKKQPGSAKGAGCEDGKEKEESTISYKDFVKHMKKLKKDIHSSIVKDVTKQTDHLLKKRLARSMSQGSGEIRSAAKDEGMVIHKGITCDNCDLEIVGVRYKCGNCDDFDLCELCESRGCPHDPTHVFLKLHKPALKAGCVGTTRLPLLRENVYEAEKKWEERHKNEKKVKGEKEKRKKKTKEREEKNHDTKKEKTISEEKLPEVASHGPEVLKQESFPPSVTEKTPEQLPNEMEKPIESTPVEEVSLKMSAVDEKVDFPITPKEVEETGAPVQRRRVSSESSSGSSIVKLSPDAELGQQLPGAEPDLNVQNQIVDKADSETECDQDNTAIPATADVCPMIALSPAQVECLPENIDNDDFSTSSSFAGYESDSSEDFCVIDHPDEDYEEIEQDNEEDGEPVRDADAELTTGQLKQSELIAAASEETENCKNEPVDESSTSEEATLLTEVRVDKDLVHQLNDEEKYHFQELLKAEMDRDSDEMKKQICKAEMEQHLEMKQNLEKEMKRLEQAEGSKHKAVNNECAANADKSKKTAEFEGKPAEDSVSDEVRDADYKEILEVKTMQAVLENTRLEDAALEEEARRVLDQEDDETKKQRELDPVYYRLQITDRRVGKMLELEVQKFAALNSGDKESLAAVERALQKLDWQQKLDEKRLELVERDIKRRNKGCSTDNNGATLRQMSSSSTQCEDSNSEVSDVSEASVAASALATEKKDADSQTLTEPTKPASHLIQNVASGMSKAASTAFSTAKDVFYSLQAKQNEWKTSKPTKWMPGANTYVPPTSSWTPPEDTYVLPRDDYVPPKNEYVPPSSTWTPPKSMLPMDGSVDEGPEAEGNGQVQVISERESNAAVAHDSTVTVGMETACEPRTTSAPQFSPFVSLENADSALRSEIQGMKRLIEMGFANRELNKSLLSKFNGNLERVIQALLQEEGGDHWAAHRH